MPDPITRPLDSTELEQLGAATGLHPDGELMREHLAPAVQALLKARVSEVSAAPLNQPKDGA